MKNICTIEEANRYLQEVYLPRHNQQFSIPANDPRAAYTPWAGPDLKEILCVQTERTVQNDNTVRYKTLVLQIPEDDLRHHYVKTTIQVKEYSDGRIGLFYGHRCLGRYETDGVLLEKSRTTRAAA